ASINADDATRYVGGARARDEGHQRGEFSRLPITGRRYARAGLPLYLLDSDPLAYGTTAVQVRDTVSRDAPRGNAVHRDAIFRDLGGERLGPAGDGQPQGVGNAELRDRLHHAGGNHRDDSTESARMPGRAKRVKRTALKNIASNWAFHAASETSVIG